MPDEEKQWYDLVKHNFLAHDPATPTVINTDRGLGYAQRMADVLTERLTPEEREAGFAVYQRKGTKPAGAKEARKLPNKRRTSRR